MQSFLGALLYGVEVTQAIILSSGVLKGDRELVCQGGRIYPDLIISIA